MAKRGLSIVKRLIAKIRIACNATSVKLDNCLGISSFKIQLTLEENTCHYVTSIQRYWTSISITKITKGWYYQLAKQQKDI